jgi:hypothetical protein
MQNRHGSVALPCRDNLRKSCHESLRCALTRRDECCFLPNARNSLVKTAGLISAFSKGIKAIAARMAEAEERFRKWLCHQNATVLLRKENCGAALRRRQSFAEYQVGKLLGHNQDNAGQVSFVGYCGTQHDVRSSNRVVNQTRSSYLTS